MKKFLLLFVLMTASLLSYAQTRPYVVLPGETLESVAHKNGISVSSLIQANPGAMENFYPGMKLNIPTKKSGLTWIRVHGDKNGWSDDRRGHGSVIMELAFQYVMPGGDTKDFFKGFNFGVLTDFGYRYFMHNNVYIEGLVGYRGYLLYPKGTTKSLNVHNITLPIHLGGYIDASENFALCPFFGPRIDFPVSDDLDVGVGVTLEFGLDFKINTGAIRAMYGLGVGDYKNLNYLSIGYMSYF